MKDKKRITKTEFYDNGGFKNPELFRKQAGKTNGWEYYTLVNESDNANDSLYEMIDNIRSNKHNNANDSFSKYITQKVKSILSEHSGSGQWRDDKKTI